MKTGLRWLCHGAVLLGLLVLGPIGCRHGRQAPVPVQPQNVFVLTTQLPSLIRRVAVLPISAEAAHAQAGAGSVQLQAVLSAEFGRSGRFEVVEISSEQMARWTGRRSWPPEEPLPADFLANIRAALDADAVLFAHLAAYQPYKPLLIGWNLKLVETSSGYILWAVDEVFDAADPAVAKSAARYGRGGDTGWGRLGGEDAVLLSPSRFAQFTLGAAFGTLPDR